MSAAVQLSADEHVQAMRAYLEEGTERAYALGNRGPIRFDDTGAIHSDILDAYWRCGFYVFEGVISPAECQALLADVDRVLDGAPVSPGETADRHGRPAVGLGFTRESFRFAAPLSDPVGGTTKNKGRHPVKMSEIGRAHV